MRIAAVWGATALLTLSAVPGTAQSYMGGGGEMSGPYAGGQYGRFGYDAEGSVGGADTTDTGADTTDTGADATDAAADATDAAADAGADGAAVLQAHDRHLGR